MLVQRCLSQVLYYMLSYISIISYNIVMLNSFRIKISVDKVFLICEIYLRVRYY